MEDFQVLIDQMINQAFDLGVSDAKVLKTSLLPVDEKFAGFCKEPPCPSYGRSKSCPPHVMGPVKFRKYLQKFLWVLVFKFDVPWEVLLSNDRRGVSRVLHETAATLEIMARKSGFEQAKGFAGGSCKEAFCMEHVQCLALSPEKTCRFPDASRQSMSGLGVDFKKLSVLAGWQMDTGIPNDPIPDSTGLMAGCVLLG